MIRVDSVTVCHLHIVQNPDSIDENILTADHVERPECGILKRHAGDCEVADILDIEKRSSRIPRTLDVVLGLGSVVDHLISIDRSVTGDPNILTGCINKIMSRLAIVFTVDIRGNVRLIV